MCTDRRLTSSLAPFDEATSTVIYLVSRRRGWLARLDLLELFQIIYTSRPTDSTVGDTAQGIDSYIYIVSIRIQGVVTTIPAVLN